MVTTAADKITSDIELSNLELQRDEGQSSIKLDRDTLAEKMNSAEVNPLSGAETNGGKKINDSDDGDLHMGMLNVEWYGYMYLQIARAPVVGAIIVTAPLILSQAERADTFPGVATSIFNASTNTTNVTMLPGKLGRLPLAPGTISTLFSSFQSILVSQPLSCARRGAKRRAQSKSACNVSIERRRAKRRREGVLACH